METRKDLEDSNKGMLLLCGFNSVLSSFMLWQFNLSEERRLFVAALNVWWIIGFGFGIRSVKKIEAGEYDFMLEEDDDWDD